MFKCYTEGCTNGKGEGDKWCDECRNEIVEKKKCANCKKASGGGRLLCCGKATCYPCFASKPEECLHCGAKNVVGGRGYILLNETEKVTEINK